MDQTTDNGGRILLVDDEAAILRTFRYCLEDRGYTVMTAASAAQAEAILQRQVFDLCFLDLRLGEDNGLDVLQQMRLLAPWMRVVIVTAHSAVDTAVDAMQAGAADYLLKPCSPEQLRLSAPSSWKYARWRRAWKRWKVKSSNAVMRWVRTARR